MLKNSTLLSLYLLIFIICKELPLPFPIPTPSRLFSKLFFFFGINHSLFLFQISQLLEEVQRLQCSFTKLQESSVSHITRLEDQLEQKRQHIVRLEAKLELQRDYEELKREIRLVGKNCFVC